MKKLNLEKIITTSFPSKTEGMLKFVRNLPPEELEWVGLLMQRSYDYGKEEPKGYGDQRDILFH